jgi:hypothetical protein
MVPQVMHRETDHEFRRKEYRIVRSEPSASSQFLSGKGIDLQNLCRIEALPITYGFLCCCRRN